MNKLFWKYFGTYTLWTATSCLTLLTLVVLGKWFTDLSFPYYIFRWDAEDRAGIFWTGVSLLGFCAMFGYMKADIELDNQKEREKMSKLTPEEQSEYRRIMIDYYRGQGVPTNPPRSKPRKGLDVVDIAVGVASGAIIGEVINDWLE